MSHVTSERGDAVAIVADLAVVDPVGKCERFADDVHIVANEGGGERL